MKKLNLSKSKFTQFALTGTEKNLIKGGDDKRGGFPGMPPGNGTHSGNNNM